MNPINKTCVHCENNFEISKGDLLLYEKVGLELPVICFFCRTKQHLAFWPYGKFRKGKSDLSGESLITILPENARYPIYTREEWHSDAWDPMEYGQDYDPSRSFFDQIKELQEKVPRPHQFARNSINSDWCDDIYNSKNCYLCRSQDNCEDVLYSYRNISIKNSIDIVVSFNCEISYSLSYCHNSYKLFYSENSRDCLNSYFLFDCRNSQNCFMCWNLRGASYCIENVQYTKEEYEKKIASYNLGSYSTILELKERFEEILKNNAVHKNDLNLKASSSRGNYLLNTKNCTNCFTLSESEDCSNCVRGHDEKSSIDTTGCAFGIELYGNCSNCIGDGYMQKCCIGSNSRYSDYLDNCLECEYCFGCVGLKKKKYCILNKQYSESEYEELKLKIVNDMKDRGEYGKFFPYDMAINPFNFSQAKIYFPEVDEKDVLKLGGYWKDVDEAHIDGITTDKLPDHIKDVPDHIITQALICPETRWRFNISQKELAFHRANNIPLPRVHFDVRILEKMKMMNLLKSFPYKCFSCGIDIEAYYRPEWGYKKIACEECYNKEIY